MLSKGDGVGIIPSLCEDVMVQVVSLVCVIGLQPGQGGGPAALRYLLAAQASRWMWWTSKLQLVGATCFGGFNPN